MLLSSRPLALFVVSLAGALALLSGCTSSPSAGPQTPATASATSGEASPSSASSSASPPSASPDSPRASATTDVNAVTLNIRISNHQVSPNGDKINVAKGQTVVLNVNSDTDDEIHAHTAGDGYELEVKAGVPATGRFVAADTGSFEVESHHLEKIIAILVVR